jgi:hypothetical protein
VNKDARKIRRAPATPPVRHTTSRKEIKIMGIFASDRDEDDAYRTSEGMLGRSIRRGTDKALKALTFGLLGGTDPVTELGKDARRIGHVHYFIIFGFRRMS